MITVPEATKKIINRSRYLSEAISKGIVNYSALARYIKPELEEILLKKISEASIIMALNRFEKELKPQIKQANIFKTKPEIIVRSNLYLVAIPSSRASGLSILISRDVISGSYFCKNQGIQESIFLLSYDLFDKYKSVIESREPLYLFDNVSTLTINLPGEALKTPGVYYFFLKSLAWEGINILEIVSTFSEFTIIVEEKDIQRVFAIIKSLFSSI